jgi:hypothetical protein
MTDAHFIRPWNHLVEVVKVLKAQVVTSIQP